MKRGSYNVRAQRYREETAAPTASMLGATMLSRATGGGARKGVALSVNQSPVFCRQQIVTTRISQRVCRGEARFTEETLPFCRRPIKEQSKIHSVYVRRKSLPHEKPASYTVLTNQNHCISRPYTVLSTARAQHVFAGQPAYAAAWPREPKSSLGGRTPLQLLTTESGAPAVEEQLIAIEL
jgi:hypothetical protein